MAAARGLALCLLVACLSWSSVGWAQAPSSSDADTHFQRGLELYGEEDYAGAAAEFAAAHDLSPEPETLFAWAQAARLAGDCATAVDLYEQFLASQPKKEDAAAARRAMALCARAEPEPEPEPEPEVSRSRDTPSARGSASVRPRSPELSKEEDRSRDDAAAAVRSRAPSGEAGSKVVAYARMDIDAAGRGAVVAPGLAFRITGGWRGFVSGLIGGYGGVEVGGKLELRRSGVRPYLAGAVPVFFADGTRLGVRGALGLRVPIDKRIDLTVEVGGAHALSVPPGLVQSVPLGSVGLELAL